MTNQCVYECVKHHVTARKSVYYTVRSGADETVAEAVPEAAFVAKLARSAGQSDAVMREFVCAFCAQHDSVYSAKITVFPHTNSNKVFPCGERRGLGCVIKVAACRCYRNVKPDSFSCLALLFSLFLQLNLKLTMSIKEDIENKVAALGKEDFAYTTTNAIGDSSLLNERCNGLLMEAAVLFVEIKNMPYLLREYGKRETLHSYKLCHAVLETLANAKGGFVNCYSPNAFLVIFPEGQKNILVAVKTALQISKLLSDTLKDAWGKHANINYAIGIDFGHILGSKIASDKAMGRLVWVGTGIEKAKAICAECAKPYFIGISRLVYDQLDEDLKVFTKHLLGIPKKVAIWSRISYTFENVKKHLYQTNHKLDLEDEEDSPQVK